MQSTNIVRKLDKHGRIVIPKKLRKDFGIVIDTDIEISTDGELIILEVYQHRCCLCGSTNDLFKFKEKWVCMGCVDGM